jgi:hypothetical protein
MKVAVVGAGVAGLAAAHALQRSAEVTLFEAQNRLGGHSDTHAIMVDGRTHSVDSGFMVFDAARSPAFSAWLDELAVSTRPAELALGVHDLGSGIQYGTRSFGALFWRWRNLGSPRLLRLLREIQRFQRGPTGHTVEQFATLGEYLDAEGFSATFRALYLVPLCRAIWSTPADAVGALAAQGIVERLRQHWLLPGARGTDWRVIPGGASGYVNAFAQRFSGTVRRGESVHAVSRQPGQVMVRTSAGRQAFDALVLACHGDAALALLEDPTREEREVLGAIRFRRYRRVVHSDPVVMPASRKVWSSWNACVSSDDSGACQVTYWMNRLQELPGATQIFVTLDPEVPLRDVWSSREYLMPMLDPATRVAQSRLREISGRRNTWYCGAYWADGFHEDGFRSGRAVARALVERPEQIVRAVG